MAGKYIFGRIAQGRLRAAKYILTLSALFLTVAVLQTTLFSEFRIWGVVPELCFVTLLTVSFVLGRETGAITGIAAGFLLDALGTTGISLTPVFYLLCGYVCGHFTRAIRPKRFTAYLAVLGCGIPLNAAMTLIRICLTYREIRLLDILLHILLPEAAVTLLFGLLLHYPVKWLCQWMSR